MTIIGTWKSVLVTKWLYCRGFQIRKWLGEFITDGKSKVSDEVTVIAGWPRAGVSLHPRQRNSGELV